MKNKNTITILDIYWWETYAYGIDRIDSYLGYFVDNCVPCCAECNRMKFKHPQKDFLDIIDKIYNYQIQILIEHVQKINFKLVDKAFFILKMYTVYENELKKLILTNTNKLNKFI